MTITFVPDRLVIQRWKGGAAKRVRKRPQAWTDLVEKTFLEAFAGSCNVHWSAAQAGVDVTVIYNRRRKDAAFAARMQAAREQGYADLEMALVRDAADAMEGVLFDPGERRFPNITPTDAIKLLKFHARAVGRPGKRMGVAPKRVTHEELQDIILRRVKAIRAHRLRELEAAMVALGPLP